MASNNISKTGYQSKAVFQVLGLLCFALFAQKSFATEFVIGGSKGWTVPTDNSEPHYNQWAEKNRFQIGDSLVFVYPAGQDSVLLVSQDDYVSCNIDNPLKKFDDGHTVFKFDQSGPHHFVSGNRENCLKNEKVVVVVLADRSNNSNNNSSAASPPPSSEGTATSPAPSSEESPSPPVGTEVNPSPSPVNELPPPPSAGSNVYMSFLECIGALIASSFVLVF